MRSPPIRGACTRCCADSVHGGCGTRRKEWNTKDTLRSAGCAIIERLLPSRRHLVSVRPERRPKAGVEGPVASWLHRACASTPRPAAAALSANGEGGPAALGTNGGGGVATFSANRGLFPFALSAGRRPKSKGTVAPRVHRACASTPRPAAAALSANRRLLFSVRPERRPKAGVEGPGRTARASRMRFDSAACGRCAQRERWGWRRCAQRER